MANTVGTALQRLRRHLGDPDPPRSGNTLFFTDDDLNELLLLNASDEYAAAADGWRMKSADVAAWYNVTLDGATLSREKAFDHALKMIEHFDNISSGSEMITSVRLQVTPVDDGADEFAG